MAIAGHKLVDKGRAWYGEFCPIRPMNHVQEHKQDLQSRACGATCAPSKLLSVAIELFMDPNG